MVLTAGGVWLPRRAERRRLGVVFARAESRDRLVGVAVGACMAAAAPYWEPQWHSELFTLVVCRVLVSLAELDESRMWERRMVRVEGASLVGRRSVELCLFDAFDARVPFE